MPAEKLVEAAQVMNEVLSFLAQRCRAYHTKAGLQCVQLIIVARLVCHGEEKPTSIESVIVNYVGTG
ncbi:MAG: hypothetical protein P8J55_14800 [Pseudomonadales bacterium]|nr:hypothetical protein [Pseudomonadales bacterium]